MTPLLRCLGLVLVVGCLSAVAVSSGVASTAGAPAILPQKAEAPPRQVMVMLHMAAPHFRPTGGYGGGYGDGEGRSARWRVAERIARDAGVSVVDEWPMTVLGVDCYVMSVPQGRTPEDMAARFSRDPAVAWSEPVHSFHTEGAPSLPAPSFSGAGVTHNDPLYRTQPAAKEWNLAYLHRFATGRDVRVAVVDSMVDDGHPDLAGRVELVRNFVTGRPAPPEEHGTAVAGVIAAGADNFIGIAGVAPQAKILGLRACWQEGPAHAASTVCDSLSVAKAVDFAIAHKAQVLNLSLSGPDDILLGKLIDTAVADRTVVVAAYDPAVPNGGFPASHRGVVAVAAEPMRGSHPGLLAAPGRDVPTTEPGGRWFLVNGSSFAAAHVSGLYALMLQHAPGARSAPTIVLSNGGATIDACATLLQKVKPCNCSCAPPNETFAAVR